VPIKPTTGVQDLYIVYKKSEKALPDIENKANLAWLAFE
jgi:hypothetical protein